MISSDCQNQIIFLFIIPCLIYCITKHSQNGIKLMEILYNVLDWLPIFIGIRKFIEADISIIFNLLEPKYLFEMFKKSCLPNKLRPFSYTFFRLSFRYSCSNVGKFVDNSSVHLKVMSKNLLNSEY